MNRREAERLCIRAVDGELTVDERKRLDAFLERDPGLRAFLEEERGAAADADIAGATLRLPAGGLEEGVLRRLGMRASRGRLWFLIAAGFAAAAVVAVVLGGQPEPDARAERPAFEETAEFDAVADVFDDGAYRLADGMTNVEVEKPTVIETSVGTIELVSGTYRITLAQNRVDVTVEKGRATVRNASTVVEVKPGETRTVERLLVAGPRVPSAPVAKSTVKGRVVDADGRAVPGARVFVDTGDETPVDAEGRFELGLTGRVRTVGARAPSFAPSDMRVVVVGDKPVHEMEIALTNPGSAVTVTVVGPDARPVAGARVSIGGDYRNVPVRPRSRDGFRLTQSGAVEVVTDESGVASADGLPPEWNKLRILADGFAPFDGYVRLPPRNHVERKQVLDVGAPLVGVVKDAAGAAVSGAVIRIRTERSAKPLPGVEATSGDGGAFRMPHAPLGKVEVTAAASDGRVASAWIRIASGKDNRWDAVLAERLAIAGVVRYEDGAPVPYARVSIRMRFAAPGDRPWLGGTNAGGEFRYDEARAAPYLVSVWHPNSKLRFEEPVATLECEPAGDLAIVVPRRNAEPEGAHVSGSLVLPSGAAAVGAQVKMWPMGKPGWNTATKIGEDGAFRLGPFAPGMYRLEIHVDGQPTLHLRDVELVSGQTNDLGGIRFEAPGRVRLEVVDASGKPVAKAFPLVSSMDQRIFYTVEAGEGGTALSEGLAAGRYLVFEGGTGAVQEVELVAGETKTVKFTRRPPRKVAVTLVTTDGKAPAELRYRVLTPRGYWIRRDTLHGESEFVVWLNDGTYTFAASDARDRKAESSVTVDASTSRIVLHLR